MNGKSEVGRREIQRGKFRSGRRQIGKSHRNEIRMSSSWKSVESSSDELSCIEDFKQAWLMMMRFRKTMSSWPYQDGFRRLRRRAMNPSYAVLFPPLSLVLVSPMCAQANSKNMPDLRKYFMVRTKERLLPFTYQTQLNPNFSHSLHYSPASKDEAELRIYSRNTRSSKWQNYANVACAAQWALWKIFKQAKSCI